MRLISTVRRGLGLAAILLLFLVAPKAMAATTDCTQSGMPAVPSTSSMANLRVPRDLRPGDAIPGSRVAITWSWTCKSTGITGGQRWTFSPEWDWKATKVADYPNVYQVSSGATGVSGIGFRILSSTGTPLAFDAIGYPNATDMGNAPAGQTSFQWSGFVELVKTSATVSAGSGSMWFYAAVLGQVWGNESKEKSKFTYSYTISETALQTCSVTSKDIAVAMPQARIASLPAISSTTQPTAFNIALSCSAGATLYVTLTDSGKPGNSGNTLSATADSTAAGIAYQLSREDGTVIGFGPDSAAAGNTGQFRVGATADGAMLIPLRAAYIRTGGMTPGSLSSKATFTLSYQ
jgi:type 1 fimbria pilin